MKKSINVLIILILLMGTILIGCSESVSNEPVYERYSYRFLDAFDTVTQVVGYAESEEEFMEYANFIEERTWELHRLFDRFNSYEGVNNIKTINDQAGVEPVKVEQEILDMIQLAKDWYGPSGGKMNIAIGALSSLWSEYREEGSYDPQNAKLPPREKLEDAAQHIDHDKVIIDHEAGTVFLEDPKMSLDVGALAKGYAAELVVNEVSEKGLAAGIISLGGNIKAFGKPLDGDRDRWGVGILDPDKQIFDVVSENKDTIFINDASVVSSGDYQRYYIVDGEIIHHIIDPDTLMPGNFYRSMTVITKHSGLADYLSTAAFLLPFEESYALIDSTEDVEGFWIMKDGSVKFTDGLTDKLRSQGASGTDD